MSDNRRTPTISTPGLETWEAQQERRAENDGMGMCNTGSGQPFVCILGGSGCNVNHALIARMNLARASRDVTDHR